MGTSPRNHRLDRPDRDLRADQELQHGAGEVDDQGAVEFGRGGRPSDRSPE